MNEKSLYKLNLVARFNAKMLAKLELNENQATFIIIFFKSSTQNILSTYPSSKNKIAFQNINNHIILNNKRPVRSWCFSRFSNTYSS